jgi:hypothetical protein
MADAARMGLFMNEETITETILLRLARSHRHHGLRIEVYNKPKERRLGADWAWCFMHDSRAVAMRVQAKRLYSGARYDALKPKGGQIKRLISQARSHHPYYVFYNDGIQGAQCLSKRPSNQLRCGSFPGVDEHWGCMIARAADVRRIGSNAMADLLPASMPWHCMLCPYRAAIGPSGIGATLADVVAANLSELMRLSGDADDGNPIVPGQPPEWVALLQDWFRQKERMPSDVKVASPDTKIDVYLEEHNLAGLALFSEPIEPEH